MQTVDVGLIGLAVMGQNLARNIANHGYQIAVYNRTSEKTTEFIAQFGNDHLTGETELKAFVETLKRPRKIIIMVKAGDAVDKVIETLLPFLEADDILIDAGNSNYTDTIRREKALAEKQIVLFGMGVSGGEEGALNGPSLMPGGTESTWEALKPMLEAIAARDFSGGPCVTHVGADGAGHYVKMVHNGIEYGVMQLMAESYQLLRDIYGLSAPEIADIFERFNAGKLNSYLFEIAVPVLRQADDWIEGDYLIDHILDEAAQKGTGKWTAMDALERGVPLPTITEAVFGRLISSRKADRITLAAQYALATDANNPAPADFIDDLENALYAGMMSIYAQGYDLIQVAASQQGWEIDLAEVSRIWEGGCIIRAKLLNTLHEAYLESGGGAIHLFEIKRLREELSETIPHLRSVAAVAAQNGIPMLGLATALGYFESMIRENLPANLIQGLRDYFGAHTYVRDDRPGSVHTEWLQNED